ncbi:MAG: hypothetical protein KC656_03885 [Myxococcales bacterium]|nr:hypothetical protein [Myxococcales bacterium]MCB9692254.1 hypothetical protein [Alphaproteobacteria bacterium]
MMPHADLPHLLTFEDQWFTDAIAWDGTHVLHIHVDRKDGYDEVRPETPESFFARDGNDRAKAWLRDEMDRTV